MVKINTTTVESYQKLVSEFRANKVKFYTYQFKIKRAFKVVIRHLNYSIGPADIKEALGKEDLDVRNVIGRRKNLYLFS